MVARLTVIFGLFVLMIAANHFTAGDQISFLVYWIVGWVTVVAGNIGMGDRR